MINMLEFIKENSSNSKIFENRDKKYKCFVCKKEIDWVDRMNFSYYMESHGFNEINHSLKDFIVCSDPCRREYILSHLDLNVLMDGVDIPKRFLGSTLELFNNENDIDIYNHFKKWTETMKSGLYLYGPVGTGKTSLAVALSIEARKREKSLTFQIASNMVNKLNYIVSSKELSDFTKSFKYFDVIVIDDLSKHHLKDLAKEALFDLFTTWYNEEKIVIITSNFNPNEVCVNIDQRLSSRLTEMCEVMLIEGEDRRAWKKS